MTNHNNYRNYLFIKYNKILTDLQSCRNKIVQKYGNYNVRNHFNVKLYKKKFYKKYEIMQWTE